MSGEFLRIIRGETEGAEFRIEAEVVIGRDVEGLGYLGESAEISRRHAKVTRAPDGGLLIQDLGSLNGTLVNGVAITQVHRLALGDTVKIGDALLVVLDAHGRARTPTVYANGEGVVAVDAPEGAPRGTAQAPPPARSPIPWNTPQVIASALLLLAIAVAVFLLLH